MTVTWNRRRLDEKGVALIAVILVAALLAAIAAAFTMNARTQIIVARNTVEGAKARALADAGINWAVYLIAQPAQAPPADGTPVTHAFPGGTVTVSVQDEGGKVDLNRASEALLRGLFIAAGLERADADALTHAVMDYRDADNLKRLHGAEDDDYRAAGLKHGAKDTRFESVDELRRVLGITDDVFAAVAGAVTVYGRRRVNTAVATPLARAATSGDGALGAAATPLAGDGADTTAAARLARREALSSTGSQITQPVPATPGAVPPRRGARAASRNTYTIRAEAITETGAVFVRQAIVRPAPTRQRPYTVLEWNQGVRLDDAPPAGG